MSNVSTPPALGAASRLALVTGGGGGIGATICQELAHAGFRVVVSDVDAVRARRVADELGAPHTAHAFDVSDEAAVEGAFDAIEAQHGPIAVLVSAAGPVSYTHLRAHET